jgi:hypothetical protein
MRSAQAADAASRRVLWRIGVRDEAHASPQVPPPYGVQQAERDTI